MTTIKRVAFIGSRRRKTNADKQLVERSVRQAVNEYGREIVFVSGGCDGPDKWAEAEADRLGLEKDIHLPILPPNGSPKYLFTQAYHERNDRVEAAAEVCVAFPSSDRKGGTEYTIKRFTKAGKPVLIR